MPDLDDLAPSRGTWQNSWLELGINPNWNIDEVANYLMLNAKTEEGKLPEQTEDEKADMERRFEQLVHDIPKAELHIHIEGTFEPDLMLKIAERNDMMDKVPFATVDEAKALYDFDGLQSFLDIYYAGCAVLKTRQDFYDLMAAYLRRAAKENVVRAEIFFDPQTHRSNGVTFETFFEGFYSAMQDAKQEVGISADLIMCFLRHEGAQAAWDTLQEALPYKDRFIAVGLDSSEAGFPPSLFKETYAEAAKHGLRAVAHAGEEGPPAYVWEALNHLKVERIDHGIRSLEDENLMEFLEESQIPLTLCPFSNYRLKVYPGEIREKLKQMLHSPLCCTINSDDPAYFGGYIKSNWSSIARDAELTPAKIVQLSLNSFRAAFISDEERLKWMAAANDAYNRIYGDGSGLREEKNPIWPNDELWTNKPPLTLEQIEARGGDPTKFDEILEGLKYLATVKLDSSAQPGSSQPAAEKYGGRWL